MATLDAAKRSVLFAYLAERTIPVIVEHESEEPGVFGTCSLVSYLGEYFLLGAGHVINAYPHFPDSLGLPKDRRGSAEIWTPGRGMAWWSYTKKQDKPDMGALHLPKERGQALATEWAVVDALRCRDAPIPRPVLLAGFPEKMTKPIGENPEHLKSQMACVVTSVRSPSPSGKAVDLPWRFLTTPWEGAEAVVPTSGPKETAHGMSGSLVWQLLDVPDDRWSPHEALRPIGIFYAYEPRDFVACVRWSVVRMMLDRAIAEISPAGVGC